MGFWYTRWDGQKFYSENYYGKDQNQGSKPDKVSSYIADSFRQKQITYSDPRNRCYSTKCPECGDEIFFVRYNGGSVWFDELGAPWPKHPCFLGFESNNTHIKFLNQTSEFNLREIYRVDQINRFNKYSELKREYLSTLSHLNSAKYLGVILSIEHCAIVVSKSKLGFNLFENFQNSLRRLLRIGLPKVVWGRIKSILLNYPVEYENLNLRGISREKRLLIEEIQFFLSFFSKNPDTFVTGYMRSAKDSLAQIHLLITMKNPYPTSVPSVEKKKFRSDRGEYDKRNNIFEKTIYSELKITFSLSDFRTLIVRIHGHVDMNLAGELCYLSYGRLVIPQQNKVFTVMSWKV